MLVLKRKIWIYGQNLDIDDKIGLYVSYRKPVKRVYYKNRKIEFIKNLFSTNFLLSFKVFYGKIWLKNNQNFNSYIVYRKILKYNFRWPVWPL
jgi:hypothetical protein